MKEQIARPDVEPPAVNTYREIIHLLNSSTNISCFLIVLQPISAVLKVKLNLKPGLDMGLPQVINI